MNELSLFSGAGGGLLATKYMLGWRAVGYVEIEEYCQKVIAQRIKDGLLDEAPIFSNLQAFNRAGFAGEYRGMVDVVTGGFPCQDISCAGSGKGLEGKKSSLWFDMAETIRIVRPRFVFVENSPMLVVRGLQRVTADLSEMGYCCQWGIISAADMGAPHLRKRLWLVAHSNSHRGRSRRPKCEGQQGWVTPISAGPSMADTKILTERPGLRQDEPEEFWWRRLGNSCCTKVSHTNDVNYNNCGHGASKICRERSPSRLSICEWWDSEPTVGRVANGVDNRVDRLKAIGNGQVPRVVAEAWKQLTTGW